MEGLTYVIGACAGLIIGGAVGYLKNLLIWQRYIDKAQSSPMDPNGIGGVYARAMISYAVNVAALVAVFFARNILPFDGIACLIGTAVALATMNKALAFRQKRREEKEAKAEKEGEAG